MGNNNSYTINTEVITTYQMSSQQEYYDGTVQSESDSITSPSVPQQQDIDSESEYEEPLIIPLESNIDNNHIMDQNYALHVVYPQCNEYDADADDDTAYIILTRSPQPIRYHTMIPTSIVPSVINNPPQQDSDNEAQIEAEPLSVPSDWETDDDPITDPLLPQQINDNDNDQFEAQDEIQQDVELNDMNEEDATNSNLIVSQQHNDIHQDDGQFEYPPWDEYDDDSYNEIDTGML